MTTQNLATHKNSDPTKWSDRLKEFALGVRQALGPRWFPTSALVACGLALAGGLAVAAGAAPAMIIVSAGFAIGGTAACITGASMYAGLSSFKDVNLYTPNSRPAAKVVGRVLPALASAALGVGLAHTVVSAAPAKPQPAFNTNAAAAPNCNDPAVQARLAQIRAEGFVVQCPARAASAAPQ